MTDEAPKSPSIRCRENGPYVVENLTTLRNAKGEVLPSQDNIALCRCGASNNKPFCDGSHKGCGFSSKRENDAEKSVTGDEQNLDRSNPSITVTKDGPYRVEGGIELQDAEWGEGATRQRYALCRCGASKNKPFCDGSHRDANFRDG